MNHKRFRLTCFAAAISATFSATFSMAFAAPETFNTALPVAEGSFVFRQQAFVKKASRDKGPGNRDLTVLGSVSVLGYGINSDFAIFGVLPLLDKTLKVTVPGPGRVKRKTSGLGDARLFARYTIFKQNAPGQTFRIAPYAGLKLPTGKSRKRDFLGTLPASFQLGSGSWDPFAGVIATWQTLAYEIDVQASYKLNSKANNFRFGDEMRFDASLQYRLWPQVLSATTSGFLYGVLEANLLYNQKDRAGSVKQANSGGTKLYIAPGLQYVTQRWIAEAIVQIPVIQNLNGAALKEDFIVRAGFRVNF